MPNITMFEKETIDHELRMEIAHLYRYAAMVGSAQQFETANVMTWVPSNNIITRFDNFKLQGTTLDIPMLQQLEGDGVYGSSTLRGTEQELGGLLSRHYISLHRYAVKIPDIVQAASTPWYEWEPAVRRATAEWCAMRDNTEVIRSLLEGYSINITAPVSLGGLGVAKRYPKNFLLWDGTNKNFTTNEITHSYNTSTYKTNIISKMGDMGTADTMTTDTLSALTPILSQLKIQRINGKWMLVVSSRQMQTLESCADFITAKASGDVRGPNNELFNYEGRTWGNFIIVVDDLATRLAYHSGSDLDFFNYTGGIYAPGSKTWGGVQAPAAGTQDVACAFILGPNALGMTVYKDTYYSTDNEDYGFNNGLAACKYWGMGRMDYLDVNNGGTPTTEGPTQAVVIGTYVS